MNNETLFAIANDGNIQRIDIAVSQIVNADEALKSALMGASISVPFVGRSVDDTPIHMVVREKSIVLWHRMNSLKFRCSFSPSSSPGNEGYLYPNFVEGDQRRNGTWSTFDIKAPSGMVFIYAAIVLLNSSKPDSPGWTPHHIGATTLAIYHPGTRTVERGMYKWNYMPNIHPNGQICQGNQNPYPPTHPDPIKAFQEAYKTFQSAAYNSDLVSGSHLSYSVQLFRFTTAGEWIPSINPAKLLAPISTDTVNVINPDLIPL